MQLKEIVQNAGCWTASYQTTWHYGYDFMLDAAQVLIDTDFRVSLERVAVGTMPNGTVTECLEQVKQAENQLRAAECCKSEQAILIVAGYSRIMECPVQLTFRNQTNELEICTSASEVVEGCGKEAFTNYLCSMEINAYVADTKRKYENT